MRDCSSRARREATSLVVDLSWSPQALFLPLTGKALNFTPAKTNARLVLGYLVPEPSSAIELHRVLGETHGTRQGRAAFVFLNNDVLDPAHREEHRSRQPDQAASKNDDLSALTIHTLSFNFGYVQSRPCAGEKRKAASLDTADVSACVVVRGLLAGVFALVR